jgi:hypothetical protein
MAAVPQNFRTVIVAASVETSSSGMTSIFSEPGCDLVGQVL